MTIKVYLKTKAAQKLLKDAIPKAADLVVDLGSAQTPPKAEWFAAQHGCRLIYCLPEAQEQFQQVLHSLVLGWTNPTAGVSTRILDSSLYKVKAL